LTPQTAIGADLRSCHGTEVVQKKADLSSNQTCWFEIMPLGSYKNTHWWLLACLVCGMAICAEWLDWLHCFCRVLETVGALQLLVGMMGQTRISSRY